MESKLTLKLDSNAIERAKAHAKKKNISLSKMVEHFFMSIKGEEEPVKTTKLVKELSGIITLDENTDYREMYGDFLIKKYK